jgi:hypothetical protein
VVTPFIHHIFLKNQTIKPTRCNIWPGKRWLDFFVGFEVVTGSDGVCYVQNIRLPVDNNRAENVIRQGGGEEELAVCRFATGESACRRHYARTAALPGKSLRLWEG